MSFSSKGRVLCLGLALVVLAAYANHFQNDFHFDDTQTVVANPYIRTLANVPRFFKDATLFSVQVGGQAWRPLVSTSLAIDYFLGRGLRPFFFHLSTFLWFLVQLVLMFFLFRRLMDAADTHPSNSWTALLAVACYGLHPVNAETINYIVQRGDLYNTLGVVASLLWFIAFPAQRRRGFYLLPAVAAFLSKAPALIYPFILLAYLYLFEKERRWTPALRAALPAFAVTLAALFLTFFMTPDTYNPGALSPWLYRLSQPWIALRYFVCFFVPVNLSADHDWGYVSGPFGLTALAGYLFVGLSITATVVAARRRQTLPLAFGIAWFLLALLPIAIYPLADVSNDHRMFFPFVGLALASFWAVRLVLFRQTANLTTRPVWSRAAVAAALILLAGAGFATRARNRVWRSEETLWRDVAQKSPANPRGLSNYGNLRLSVGDVKGGIQYLERAQNLRPEDSVIELRLANAYAAVRRDDDAARHYERAISLAGDAWTPRYFYGRWLASKGRFPQSRAQLATAMRLGEAQAFAARYLLMQVLCEQRDWEALDGLVAQTLAISKDDEVARGYSAPTARLPHDQVASPDRLLEAAANACGAGLFESCLAQARQSLAIRPNFAEAYYVAASAMAAGGKKPDAIHALRMALRIRPDFEPAKRALSAVID